MTTVQFNFVVPGGTLFKAAVDLKGLKFSGGTASKSLKERVEHSLQWFVRGAPGVSYAVEITSPASVKFKHQATLDSAMKDAGVHWFTIPVGGGQ